MGVRVGAAGIEGRAPGARGRRRPGPPAWARRASRPLRVSLMRRMRRLGSLCIRLMRLDLRRRQRRRRPADVS